MAPHSRTLAWKISWAEEPGRLQSMGSRRVGHDWATSLSLFTFTHWRRKRQPTPVFLPGESQGRWSLMGCRLGSDKVGHDWSNLAAAAAALTSLKCGKEPACQCRRLGEKWVWSLGQEDPMKEGIATHSSILAWRIPWTEEPGELQPMGSQSDMT